MNFEGFNKISRLSRDCVITEKIDGINVQIYIQPLNHRTNIVDDFKYRGWSVIKNGDFYYGVTPGSKNKWITPKKDNFGFAQWVLENSDELLKLGCGRHFGEWWGQGIQRRYNMDKKVLSLFNIARWSDKETRPECCDVVPVLYEGLFDTQIINDTVDQLEVQGSVVSPGYMDPEGVVIFHTHNSVMFKKTIKDDEKHKQEII